MIGVKTKKDKQQLVEHKQQKQIANPPAQADLQQALAFPQMATPDEVLALQQTAGNTAVTGWLGADTANGRLDEQFSSTVQQSRGNGMPLPPMLREEMEQSFKTSFDSVRLHTDEQADALSQQISARAFTIGPDIYFRQGTYSPNTPEGRHTLKHELTHVIQQGGRFDPQLKLGPAHDEHEQEAERFSQDGTSHPLASKPDTTAPTGAVQRFFWPWQQYKKKQLGGSLNTVYRVKHRQGNVGYFKPNSEDDPMMGSRAVLSSDIDQTLRTNALSKETYSQYDNKEGAESSEVPGKTITENEFNTPITKKQYLEGSKYDAPQYKMQKYGPFGLRKKYFKMSGTKYNTHDFSHPETQKGLASVQLQDAITGQMDRHGGNIKINPVTHQAKGYDNDLMELQTDTDLSEMKKLHKSPGEVGMTPERAAARQEALKKVNRRWGKQVGLPSHIDKEAAERMIGMKSSAFMARLEESNRENMARLTPEMKAELKNRYSSVRRYAKAGLASSGLVTDPTKAAKWSSPAYQETVRKGAGALPSIVGPGSWNQQTYNEQLSKNIGNPRNPQYNSYLQRAVLNYNDIQREGGSIKEGRLLQHLDNPHATALPTPPPVVTPPVTVPTPTVTKPPVVTPTPTVTKPPVTTPTPTVVPPRPKISPKIRGLMANYENV